MPSALLWAFWIVGGMVAVCLVAGAIAEQKFRYAIFPIVYTVLSYFTIAWYLNALDEFRKHPPARTILVSGRVETTILPTGAKISTVKTPNGIINISDTFHQLIPEGAFFERYQDPDRANGISFSSINNYAQDRWWLPENR